VDDVKLIQCRTQRNGIYQSPLQKAERNRCVEGRAGSIERHGCRESRDGPGMALRGGPPRPGPRSNDGVREVERSETRMMGHSVFAYFFAGPAIRRLKKVSRRKGETGLSGDR